MNTCVVKYTPKDRHYSKSVLIEARVKVAAGIYNDVYHFSWMDVMKKLAVNPTFCILEGLHLTWLR